MEWKFLFKDYILERGYDYYMNDQVGQILMRQNRISAIVQGTDDYEVDISFNNRQVAGMHCTCSYAESGNNCKHMAAVLFAYGSQDDVIDILSEGKQRTTIEELVNQADEKIIRQFLVELLKENERLCLRFKTILLPESSESDIDNYKYEINQIIASHLDRRSFINYYDVDDLYSDIVNFFYEDVHSLIDHGKYEIAFELTNYIFISLGKEDIDGTGELGIITDECYSFWEKILEHVGIDLKRKMFRWFAEHLDYFYMDYLDESIESILFEHFNEAEFIDKKLEITTLKISKAVMIDTFWLRNDKINKWSLWHLQLLKRKNNDWKEIIEYCKQYWEYSDVRKFYIDACIEREDYHEAIEALKESIHLDQEFPGIVSEHSMKLKELYRKMNDKENYLKQLWKIVLKDDKGNIDIFRELKLQYTEEEWMLRREIILMELENYHYVDKLYIEEKLFDRLLKYVQKSEGLNKLEQHKDLLIQRYPIEILEKYRVEVEKMAIHTTNRKKYREIVTILREMKKIIGGEQVVNEIVQEWQKVYRNRRAMMDEISKL